MGNLVSLNASGPALPPQLQADLHTTMAAVRPATTKEIAVKLEDTLSLWTLPESWSKTAKFYVEAMEGLPSDLVDHALKEARMHCKFMPKPAELRGFVDAEMGKRQRRFGEARKRAEEWKNKNPMFSKEHRKEMGRLMGVLAQAMQGDKAAQAELEPLGWNRKAPV